MVILTVEQREGTMSHRVGVVLAGGSGHRLGRSKGGLRFGGIPLAERAAGVLLPFCGRVLISIEPGGINPAPTFQAIEDMRPARRGPLAGIEAAFEATGGADLLVLACDYPRVQVDLIQHLLIFDPEAHDIVMPTDTRGRAHPLVALWSRRTEEEVRRALQTHCYKVHALFDVLRVLRIAPGDLGGLDVDRALTNVNTLQELEALEAERKVGL
jgi:molybdopterin-guanine dinucleotide biosynthesis protein A